MQTAELKTCVEPDWFIYNNLIAKQMVEGDINDFTNWEVMRDTMTYPTPPQMAMDFLKSMPDWDKWKKAIEEVPIGNPPLYEFHPQSNGTVVHQANHLAHFLSRTNCKLDSLDTIYEFGAGYGCMCRLIHNLGFTGKYVIMDLPAVIALQRWYLGATVRGQIIYYSESDDFIREMEDKSLFIATWSLSEVCYSLREKILGAVCGNVDYMLFGFQGMHREFDNLNYFVQKVMFANPEYRWDLLIAPHILTNRQHHYYMFGELL